MEQQDAYGKMTAGAGVPCESGIGFLPIQQAICILDMHAAAWGDSVARLMKASGYDVTREYYVNDAGNQITNLGLSLQARYREYLGMPFELPQDGYHGDDGQGMPLNWQSSIRISMHSRMMKI